MTALIPAAPCGCTEDVWPLDCCSEMWCERHNSPERSACTHSSRCQPCQADRLCRECRDEFRTEYVDWRRTA